MNEPLVIADAGPLIAFASIGRLDLLGRLFRNGVSITPLVREEIAPSLPDLPNWLTVDGTPVDAVLHRIPSALDAGEHSSLALALTLGASILLLDDLNARKAAARLGLHPLGSFGIVALARKSSLVTEGRPLLDALVSQGLYASFALYCDVLASIDEPVPADHPFTIRE